MERIKIVVIVGPTASGKTRLAIEIAERFNGEIVSADSRQVYRYMDIGTAKPTREDRKRVPHHLIDIVNPDDDFTAGRFREEAVRVIQDIYGRGKNIFVVGGTGLYVKVLTNGLFKGPGGDECLRAELRRMGGDNLYEKLKE
ncbi:MAG: tRNA (adenosine(37)-N6)-dimethylallyltransferase MiaA, partial [Deltaproteobacteria bacterium]|nr:tRNA (adenosine(37)-N6)-dimethylallyltransferase MiaA [Deltaproteobacteria bacterium]